MEVSKQMLRIPNIKTTNLCAQAYTPNEVECSLTHYTNKKRT